VKNDHFDPVDPAALNRGRRRLLSIDSANGGLVGSERDAA
jgi:hypothetical protein